jgi:histidinol dehydrogenase
VRARTAASSPGCARRATPRSSRWRRAFDGADLAAGTLEVPRAEWRAALEDVDAGLRRALERAAANIRTVHEAFRPRAVEVEPEPGVVVGPAGPTR